MGTAESTAHHHHAHDHFRDKFLGTRDSAFPLSKPLPPSSLGGSEAGMGHLVSLTEEPQGISQTQVRPSHCPPEQRHHLQFLVSQG